MHVRLGVDGLIGLSRILPDLYVMLALGMLAARNHRHTQVGLEYG